MADLYAFTDIKAGDDGKEYTFSCGDLVTGVPQNLMKQLVASGAIAKYDRTAVEDQSPVDLVVEEEETPPPVKPAASAASK